MVVQNGKTAIVTDAAGGIGATIARRLGRDGFAVVVSFAALRDEADVQVTAIRALGGRAADGRRPSRVRSATRGRCALCSTASKRSSAASTFS